MNRFRKEDISQLKAGDAHELSRALEVQSILDCVEITARTSLKRKESRWSFRHHRTDFPERDDENWLRGIIIRKNFETRGMTLSIRRLT